MKSKYSMRLLALSIIAIVLSSLGVARAEEKAPDQAAVQVAEAWFNSLMKGQTEVTTSLSDAPFSFDGKRDVATLGELKQIFQAIVKKKGKRNIEAATARIVNSTPKQITVLITIEGDDETISVFVKPGKRFESSDSEIEAAVLFFLRQATDH